MPIDANQCGLEIYVHREEKGHALEENILNFGGENREYGKERLEWTLMLAWLAWEAQITQREDAECADK